MKDSNVMLVFYSVLLILLTVVLVIVAVWAGNTLRRLWCDHQTAREVRRYNKNGSRGLTP